MTLTPGASSADHFFRFYFETTTELKWLLFLNVGHDPYGYSVKVNTGDYYAFD